MKMVIAIVQNSDVSRLSESLIQLGVRVTKLASTGGFLRAGNTTFMIGVDDWKVSGVLDTIKRGCQPREEYTPLFTAADDATDLFSSFQDGALASHSGSVQVGGATVFVIPVEQFYRF